MGDVEGLTRRARLAHWLDERTGYRAILSAIADEPVPGGARFAYVFGSVLVFALVVQALSGVLLATVYAPSASTAYDSVKYIQEQLSLGWLIRGAHSVGASAIVAVTLLHLAQVTIWGAYRKPREMNWLVGLALFGCLLAFAVSGYLLPWDQEGYWSTRVVTSLVGQTPLLGGTLERLLIGGDEYGNLTLTRFYALHVLVLPALLVALLAAHLYLFRRHGVTPSAALSDATLVGERESFWPGQVFRDVVAMVLFFALVGFVVIARHGVPLDAAADPASAFEARPPWYFLPLYQLLKLVPAALERWAALGAPLVVIALLAALPFVDRGTDRRARARLLVLVPVGTVFAIAAGLALSVPSRDHAGPSGSAAAVSATFDKRCAGCHRLGGRGEQRAPDLDGWSSRAWLTAFLRDPSAPRFYGATKIRGMKPVKQNDDEVRAMVEWIYAESGAGPVDAALVLRGKKILDGAGCDNCHEPTDDGGDGVPSLTGRASSAWIRAFLLDPSAPRFFGNKNHMPKMEGRLSAAELDEMVLLLEQQRSN